MPERRFHRPVAVLVTAAGLLAGCAGVEETRPAPVASTTATRSPAAPPAAPAAPASLSIPALDVTGDLVDLGLADSGELEVPQDPDDIGWFAGGGRPGGPGPTVVVGHVDSRTGPAVFARLGELREGDVLSLVDTDGTRHDYRVTDRQQVPQDPFPTEAVFGRTSTDQVRLITCTGAYDRSAGRYTENLLVTAERV